MNRLHGHPSPYLEQHADNPVDWWPWSDEAFEEARRRDVPVFLSIGYATCHWCHVMAHESFEDEDVAALLNRDFVSIKVDREERPDIDDTYMAVCQAMNGTGGWPLTVLLDPARRPWFTGTYFPKHGRGHHPGMMELLPRLSEVWATRRQDLEDSAKHVLQHIQTPAGQGQPPRDDGVAAAADALTDRFDTEHAGFGRAPKFPSPHQITLLLRDDRHRDMALASLDAMAAGGIHDHVGGGFHRYSTDPAWLVPHFEKMLYDQATLLMAYTEAWQVSKEPRYQRVAAGIVTYVLRDLRHPDGGFFSAEDADSEGEEGTFYVWSDQELVGAVGKQVAEAFGSRPGGNFHDEATGRPTGKNILHVTPGTDTAPYQDLLDGLRQIRAHRPRPLRDEKVLADWNGLWLTALARAAATFDRQDWLDAAMEGGRFWIEAFDAMGTLRHRWRDGQVDDDAFLDDHAFGGLAMVSLFEVTGDATWMAPARHIAHALLARFQDQGAFLQAPKDAAFRLARRTEAYDGAAPSGNSLAVEFLWRLGRITGEVRWEQAAWGCVEAFGNTLSEHPSVYCAFWQSIDNLRQGREVVTTTPELARAAWQVHAPDAVRILRHGDTGIEWIDAHDPKTPAAYVCRDHACQAPVFDAEALATALG